jgi:hypothetical protein
MTGTVGWECPQIRIVDNLEKDHSIRDDVTTRFIRKFWITWLLLSKYLLTDIRGVYVMLRPWRAKCHFHLKPTVIRTANDTVCNFTVFIAGMVVQRYLKGLHDCHLSV